MTESSSYSTAVQLCKSSMSRESYSEKRQLMDCTSEELNRLDQNMLARLQLRWTCVTLAQVVV